MKVVTREELERVIHIEPDMIEVVEGAFNALVNRTVWMPPIMRIDVPENNGEVDIKSAYISGYDSFAIKISSGFFNNPQIGLPSANGLMMLLSSETGVPQAILADNGYLTDMRTAAAGAIAAKYLSRSDSKVAGIIGTGAQAKYQLIALTQVREIDRVIVYGRRSEKANQYKVEIEEELGLSVEVADDIKQVVTNSDIVVTTTPATEPLIQADWLHPGLHITAMGSDAEHKQELDARVLETADLVVCDVKSQAETLGELRSCTSPDVHERVLELGEITSGQKQGRTDDQQVTVCDLTGTGVQDTAIARHADQLLTSTNQ
ncbi:cyclodeaminase [Thalassobacillus sp. CUG 92003]|uniref:cyclodeaminase n=1 Tax=Thalassobacillus sp. CUG 92003 TaxID=2736641 RepID=UPI0015E70E2B|nr:cyclodeaminase [Thalassobacillus sp. CUG 92003]